MAAPPTISNDEFDRLWRIGKALAMSGTFKDVNQAEQAFAKILMGRDLGLTPIQSLMSLDVVKGNLQMRAVLMASFVRKSESYDYKKIEHDENHCKIEFFEKSKRTGDWESAGISEYSIEDAKKQGVFKKDGAWTTVPRNMVFARAMSNGCRWYCPDVLGGMPVYTEADYFEDRVVQVANEATKEKDDEVPLPQAALRVINRAIELGHDNLSDRSAAHMACDGQPENVVRDWYDRSMAELDEVDPAINPPEAEVVKEEPVEEAIDRIDVPEDATPEEVRSQAKILREQAGTTKREDTQATLFAQADALEAEAARMEGGS